MKVIIAAAIFIAAGMYLMGGQRDLGPLICIPGLFLGVGFMMRDAFKWSSSQTQEEEDTEIVDQTDQGHWDPNYFR